MLSDTTMREIMAALRSCYGDLDSPTFHKVAETLGREDYRPLIEALRASGITVDETTDPNDDVSIQLIATRLGEQAALELSAVGPFAVLRHLGKDGSSRWVTRSVGAPCALAADIAALVERSGLRLLDRDAALIKVGMRLTEDVTQATLYQALFTNTDRVP